MLIVLDPSGVFMAPELSLKLIKVQLIAASIIFATVYSHMYEQTLPYKEIQKL